MNFWQKKRSCICKFVFFVLVWCTGISVYSQKEVHFHVVLLEKNIFLSKNLGKDLKTLGDKVKLDISFDVFIHPLVGKLAPIFLGDSMPYFSTSMRKCRDAFFNNSHKKRGSDYYFFLANTSNGCFVIPGKNLVFQGRNTDQKISESLFRSFAAASGVHRALDSLSLDSVFMQFIAIDSVQSHVERTYPFMDDTENLASTNGIVAYAFWEKNPDGTLVLPQDLELPFKRNFGKVNLAVDNYWIRPFYSANNRFIAPVHFALVFLVFFIMLLLRKQVNKRADRVFQVRTRRALKVLRTFLWMLFFVIGYLVFWSTDAFYKATFFNSTKYHHLGNISMSRFKQYLFASNSALDQPANAIFWEVYIKENNLWKMKRMKKVLYFEVVLDAAGARKSIRFLYDSDVLHWKKYNYEAQTHLMVHHYYTEQGVFVKSRVYNYSKVDITHKFNQPDPAKRILLFVNGYRPVSQGLNPDKALENIQKKGIEFPNSKNICYNDDRFNYWRPWGGFDLRFIERIKPNEVYYADGHHAVSTSNYRSIINFVQTATNYPRPCRGLHHCEFYNNSEGKGKTLSQLPFQSNKEGFNIRRINGRIAGENLLQLLNEVPRQSGNDTLFVVTHSMGYAYALGMLDALQGTCQFKAFYILAPENAEAGSVNTKEWEEVYQYGSFPFGLFRQAPCLQDGIAPQTAVKGLTIENRITFPLEYEKKMSFAGSHFVGNYDWIFDLPSWQIGSVKQH